MRQVDDQLSTGQPESIDFGQPDTCALFGGGRALVTIASQLKERGMTVKVFTSPRLEHRPVAPSGRRQSDLLSSAGVSVICVDSISKCEEALETADSGSIGLSFGAPWIFSRRFLKRWSGRLLNSHPAPLPVFRGGGGYSWRIMMGDRSGTSLLHQIDRGIDTGPLVIALPYVFPDECRTPGDYDAYAIEQDLRMLDRFFNDVADGKSFKLTVQDEAKSSYFPRLHTPSHAYVNWAWNGQDIKRFIDAFDDPYPGARTIHGDQIVQLKSAFTDDAAEKFHSFQSGLVYRKRDGKIWVAAQGGGIIIESVRFEDASDALGEIKSGDRLHTPSSNLERATTYRAIYGPSGLLAEHE